MGSHPPVARRYAMLPQMQCTECSQTSIGTCSVCGKPKCSMHMVLRHYDRHTGQSVGPWAIREEGHESAGLCRSCDDRQFSDAAAALTAATDPAEVLRLVSAGPPPHVGIPTNVAGAQAWHGALTEAWRGLVARGVVGQATHDLITTHVRGKNSRIRLEEVSRTAVWRAPDAGRIHHSADSDGGREFNARFDVWVREDGYVFPPYLAQHSNGGGLHVLKRDIKGRVYEPNPLLIVVPRGAAPRTRTSGMYYERRVELVEGITATSRFGIHEGHGCTYDLRAAVTALLKHQAAA
jgi:hypothetical protein